MSDIQKRHQNIATIILAGGSSTRFGEDKRFVQLHGVSLIDHVVNIASQISDRIVLVGQHDEPRIQLAQIPPSLRWVTDEVPGRGPIEGLRAGFQSLREQTDVNQASSDLVLVLGCDYPLFRPPLAEMMVEVIGQSDVACVVHRGIRNPLPAVYRTGCGRLIDGLIADQNFSLQSLLDQVHVRELTEQELETVDPELDSIRNLNDRNDFRWIRDKLEST